MKARRAGVVRRRGNRFSGPEVPPARALIASEFNPDLSREFVAQWRAVARHEKLLTSCLPPIAAARAIVLDGAGAVAGNRGSGSCPGRSKAETKTAGHRSIVICVSWPW